MPSCRSLVLLLASRARAARSVRQGDPLVLAVLVVAKDVFCAEQRIAAVGLPAGLLIGFLLLLVNIGHLSSLLAEFLDTTLTMLAQTLAA